MLKDEGLEISALSCHGNCLHPDKAFAKANQIVQTKTIKLGLLADLTSPVFSTLVVPITDAQQVYWDNVNAAGPFPAMLTRLPDGELPRPDPLS